MKQRPTRFSGFHPTSLIAGVLLLLILFVSAGYFFFLHEPGLSPDRQAALTELQLRRSEWQAERPPAFRYEVERQCECPLDYTEPFTVVEYLDDPDNEAWIDGFFEAIEAGLLAGERVAVIYDPRFGYPADFTIGSEETFVRNFIVLEYASD